MIEILAAVLFIIAIVVVTVWIMDYAKRIHTTEHIQSNEKEIDHTSEFYRHFLSKVPDGADAAIHFIDKCIETAADNYTVMMLSQNTVQYLNDEDIERMRRYIMGTVNLNITDATMEMISWTHDVSSYDKLEALLDLRIKIFLVGFVADYNREIPDDQ